MKNPKHNETFFQRIKLTLITFPENDKFPNKRSEYVSKCIHQHKCLLCYVQWHHESKVEIKSHNLSQINCISNINRKYIIYNNEL